MTEPDPAPKSGIARHLPLIVIVLAAIAGFVLLRDQLSLDTLATNRIALLEYRDAHYGLTVVLFMLTYIAIVTLSLPGAAVATITGGFLFGVFPGVIINVVAATIGSIIVFSAARAGLGADVSRRIEAGGGAAARIQAGLRKNEWSMLFMMRFIPIVPFFLSNLIPAFMGVRLSRFSISTFFGIMPGALVFTSIGSGLGEVFARGETPHLASVFSGPILLPLLGLAALSALPMVIKYGRRTKG